jgi:hypothetical protein
MEGHVVEMKKRWEQSLDALGREPDQAFRLSAKQLMTAICLTQLGHYADASHLYSLALQSALSDRFWYHTSQPNWLIDTYVSSDRPDLFSQVLEEIEAYKLDPRGASLVALYSYGMACLLSEQGENAKEHVRGLLQKPRVRTTYAMGKSICAIIEGDQPSFDAALEELLKAHRGQAKFGGLRETPEGYLCLPAMSLSKLAWEKGMTINAESEYLSKGYLEYLIHR